MATDMNFDNLRAEIKQLRNQARLPADDQAFVYWYCLAALASNEADARKALVGGAGDITADAIYIDETSRIVFIVQGKYHSNALARDLRTDLAALSELGDHLTDGKELERRLSNADALVAVKLREARERVVKRQYRLALHFVSTGHIPDDLAEEFEEYGYEREYAVLNRRRVLNLFVDYEDGAVPPVPHLDLLLDQKDSLNLHDRHREIGSWVVVMKGADVGELYQRFGARLFARNIRGFLGKDTPVNKAMRDTLRLESDRFWYYNNGIAIVCDTAKQILDGQYKLRVVNPQIINGQQTTRMLAEMPSDEARVLVRVTAIPRNTTERQRAFGELVEKIVQATNSQNRILPSDLRSNDSEQVRIERELRKQGYLYLRKRESKQSAKVRATQKFFWTVQKDQLAQAVGACVLDPYEVRMGKERLFESDNYFTIFRARAIPTYLTCFWLRNAVRKRSKGRIQRTYANSWILNLLWRDIQKRAVGVAQQRSLVRFFETSPWDEKGRRSLGRAIDLLWKEVWRYYRSNRGKGEGALDPSSFFRRQRLHSELQKFWDRRGNPSRTAHRRALDAMFDEVGKAATEAAQQGA